MSFYALKCQKSTILHWFIFCAVNTQSNFIKAPHFEIVWKHKNTTSFFIILINFGMVKLYFYNALLYFNKLLPIQTVFGIRINIIFTQTCRQRLIERYLKALLRTPSQHQGNQHSTKETSVLPNRPSEQTSQKTWTKSYDTAIKPRKNRVLE